MPEVVMVEFDAGGEYLKTSVRAVLPKPMNAFQNSAEPEVLRLEALRDWQKEVGFKGTTISVKPFFLSERWIGIQDLPDHYQEALEHPEKYEDERKTELQEDIRSWIEQGDFVLYWCEEYYLNREGEVESS